LVDETDKEGEAEEVLRTIRWVLMLAIALEKVLDVGAVQQFVNPCWPADLELAQ
jgi:hypothetical protein